MERSTLVKKALNAYTLEDCISAEEALLRWLNAHPDDLGLHEIAGQLGIVKAAALEREAERSSVEANQHPSPTAAVASR